VVEALRKAGADAVAASRSSGVDVTTGEGLDEALAGARRVIDLSTGPSPDEAEAREFFLASAHNLQAAAERAGVETLAVLSIVGVAQEHALQSGKVPAVVFRSTQFFELLD